MCDDDCEGIDDLDLRAQELRDEEDDEQLWDALSAAERDDLRAAQERLDRGFWDPSLTAFADEFAALIRAGDTDEAVRRLRLMYRPKWASLAACEAAYAQAKGPIQHSLSLGDTP